MANIGDRIKLLREKKELTQLELSEKVGINNSVMSRIEAGKRPVEDSLLKKFAEVLEVSADYLVGNKVMISPTPDWASSRDIRDFKKFLEQQEVMFDGTPMSEEDKEKVIRFMEFNFWEAKQLNKRKKKTDDE